MADNAALEALRAAELNAWHKWKDALEAFHAPNPTPAASPALDAAHKKWLNAQRAVEAARAVADPAAAADARYAAAAAKADAAEAGGGGGVPPPPLHRPQLRPAGGAGAANGGAPLAGEADGANNVPQHKIPELIAFLNGKIIYGTAIQVKVAPNNLGINKHIIRVVFNVPGVDNEKKPTYDININDYEFVKAEGADLAEENQKIDELRHYITVFKNQHMKKHQGGRRIKYTKKRATHKKRTRRIRRKHSRRN